MDVNEFETRAHALFVDATLGYDQKARRLADWLAAVAPLDVCVV